MSTSTSFELRFQPTIGLINQTRRYVCDFFEPVLEDPDIVSRLGIATHELLENVFKYATDGRTATCVNLQAREDGTRELSIATTSKINHERRAGLEEIFQEMATASDASAYYQLTMLRACRRKEGSGLGLARVWAEAEMTLSIDFTGDDSVTIRAVALLSTEL